ncbi:hypothetical protein EJB05_43726 [Eragrostis curvula]|uniref:Uncharacterized protein n=1 Tax=Eragrostis curvula TaxID=38414 RepID=A0A5J9TFM1_9POAL|nr:hypothetical protein EJB05_43726 [Eragrostis curvula]
MALSFLLDSFFLHCPCLQQASSSKRSMRAVFVNDEGGLAVMFCMALRGTPEGDGDGLTVSELIGCAQARLKDLQPSKVKDVWLKLVKDLDIQRDKKGWGQAHLELLYCPFDMKKEAPNTFRQQFFMTSM